MQEKQVSGQKLVLCCGKRRGCPVIAEEDGGFVLSEHGESVRFDREQAAKLFRFLGHKLYGKVRGGPEAVDELMR